MGAIGILLLIIGSIVVLFLNYEIFNYYKCWAGASLPEYVIITPALPFAAEIPLGILAIAVSYIAVTFINKKSSTCTELWYTWGFTLQRKRKRNP